MSSSPGTTISFFRNDVLNGRVALITGGGSGIGFETARQYGLHGAKGVVLMGRREKFLNDAVELLKKENIAAVVAVGDVRKPEDCAAAVKCATDAFGNLDIVIHAAAGNFLAVAEDLSPNGFKTVMEIDTLGAFNIAHAAFAPLKASKFGGNVICITATLHYTATWYQSAPVAAKAAIDALCRNLAMEWGEFKIRVNTIAPGPIADTPGFEKLAPGADSKQVEDILADSLIPLKRAGTKAEVASTCIFFCLNNYITGQSLPVDGGEWFGKKPHMPKEMVRMFSRGIEKQSRDKGPSSKL